MNIELLTMIVEQNTRYFLSLFKNRNNLQQTKNYIDSFAQTITECAEQNRVATIQAIVNTVCTNNPMIVYSLTDVLNLILYTGLYWKAHKMDFATNIATVYLTDRHGTTYELYCHCEEGAYIWTYEIKGI